MNSKTAKLIRRYARHADANPEDIKALWKKLPSPLRGKLSKNMASELTTKTTPTA